MARRREQLDGPAAGGGLLFLLRWSVGLVGLFTATAAKRDHYILPMIPAVCLLMGYAAEDVFFTRRWFSPRTARRLGVGYGILGVGGAILTAVMACASREPVWKNMLVPVAIAAIPAALAGWLAWRGRFRFVLGLIAAAVMIVFLGHWNANAIADEYRPVADFARQVRARVHDEPVYSWGTPQSRTVFYFGRPIPIAQWAVCPCPPGQRNALLVDYLRRHPSEMPWIIGYEETEETLASLGYQPFFQKQDVKNRRRPFTLYHREPAGPSRAKAGPADDSNR